MKYLLFFLPFISFAQVWEVPNGTYSNSASDDTVVWYDMIRDADVAGIDTIKISGTWQLGGAGRFGSIDNLVIQLEEGALVTTITTGDLTGLDGNNCKCWNTVSNLVANYPTRGGTGYVPTTRGWGPFWFGPGTTNVTVIAYGATIEGHYPTRNAGTDPSAAGTQNTWEFYHGLQIDGGGGTSNIKVYGGTWQGFAGDGINIFEVNGLTEVKDVLLRWNKRLGLALINIEGPFRGENIEVFQNGRGPDITDWGTNTRHGITLEPEDPGSAYDDIIFTNIRAVENTDSNIGLHLWNLTSEAGVGSSTVMSVSFDGLHLEDGSTTADNTPSSAIYVGPTDAFNDDKGANAVWADDPRAGTFSFTNYAIWGDYENGISGRMYGGTTTTFDEGVIYKVSYTGDQTSLGLGPVAWQPLRNASTPTGTLANINFGDLTVINTGNNAAPINLSNFDTYTTIASTVTGNITSDDSWTGSTLRVVSYTGATNNSSFSETAFPTTEPTVSISVVDNNLAESDLSTARVRFTRTGATTFPLAIHYTVTTSGSAVQRHNNYEMLRGSVVIPVGSETVDQVITPIRNNGVVDGSRSITLTITPKADLYTVGASNSGTVFLTDTPESTPNPPTPPATPGTPTKGSNAMLITH